MRVKGNLLFSNQSFIDANETAPIVINLDAVAYIGSCQITNDLSQGKKVCVMFDDNNKVIIEENIEDVVTELWNNYDRDY